MRNWKIGTLSVGILLIALGLLWISHSMFGTPIDLIMNNIVPIVLITLGLEVLFHHFIQKEKPAKFDVFGIFLILLVVGASSAVYVLQSAGIMDEIRSSINQTTQRVTLDKKYDLQSQVKKIVITSTSADITITGADTNALTTSGYGEISVSSEKDINNWRNTEAENVKTIGDTMYYTISTPPAIKKFFNFTNSHIKLDITVPKNVLLELKLDFGNVTVRDLDTNPSIDMIRGELNLQNLKNGVTANIEHGKIEGKSLVGTVNIQAISGDINLTDVQGKVELSDKNGSIRASKITGEMKLHAISGNIELNTVQGQIDAQTEHGSIHLERTTFSMDSKLETVSGNINVQLEKNPNITVEAKSRNGNLDGEISTSTDAPPPHENKKTFGNGQYKVKIFSENGGIRVEL